MKVYRIIVLLGVIFFSSIVLHGQSENLNWITSKAYNINGILKTSSRAYYNDLGKLIQTQNLDIDTDRIWVVGKLYDSYGRAALESLSAPITNNGNFLYQPNFIRNSFGLTYSVSDFESDEDNPSVVGEQINTLGWYYSNQNTDAFASGNSYQDVTNYPFTRTIYSNLNSGKPLKQLGGNKTDEEWKQSYSYSMMAGQELSQPVAFNDVAYNSREIIKTIVRDLHGTEVVAFENTDGQRLATARTGGVAVRNSTITISEQGYVDVHIPINTVGFTITDVTGIITEVYDLITEQITTVSTSSLPNGFYRVSITNLENYNPQTTPVNITYKENYYDYSLNEYDEGGRLIVSKQPLQHLETTYSYNAAGELLGTTSVDGGTTNFKYRKDGQIRYSQNSKQLTNGEFSYSDYDDMGRSIEGGVLISNAFISADPDAVLPSGTKKEEQYTVYDEADISGLHAALNTSGISTANYTDQTFVAGNVSKTYTLNPSTTTTWYSYDIYGRIKWLVQNINGLGVKTIHYQYNQITGKVTQVDFQRDVSSERFIHRYTYDLSDDSLIKVETSTDGTNFITHADYEYYETGALKRLDIAEGLQGMDYVYNLNGQLKSINHPSLTAAKDPGGDNNDLFGMMIDYHKEDYIRPLPNIETTTFGEDQYNGNIKSIRWNNGHQPLTGGAENAYHYKYNKENWLTEARFGQFSTPPQTNAIADITSTAIVSSGNSLNLEATNSITLLPGFEAQSGSTVITTLIDADGFQGNNGDYDVSGITYDANGNIQTLKRNKHTESGTNAMDDFTYNYKAGKPNQLDHVQDAVTSTTNADDLKTQTGNNYIYNSIGQLVTNVEEGYDYIYNASGLVTEIHKDNQPLVKFYYNDKSHRVRKEVYNTSGTLIRTDYYVRDASGNTLAVYEDTTAKEHTIYGSSRLGVYRRSDNSSLYQLTDHVGNVRVVVGRTGNGTPIGIVAATDYYPFGMPMPSRNLEGDYRYAFQGQEKDPETGKEAFELRLWDSRIGRWLTIDPQDQYHSPYLGMGNNPINGVDPSGGIWFGIFNINLQTGEVTKISDEGDDTGEHTINYVTNSGKRIGHRKLSNFEPGGLSFGAIANYGNNKIVYNTIYNDLKTIVKDDKQLGTSAKGLFGAATSNSTSSVAKVTTAVFIGLASPFVIIEAAPLLFSNSSFLLQGSGVRGAIGFGEEMIINNGQIGNVDWLGVGLSAFTAPGIKSYTNTILGSTVGYSFNEGWKFKEDFLLNLLVGEVNGNIHSKIDGLIPSDWNKGAVKVYGELFKSTSTILFEKATNGQ